LNSIYGVVLAGGTGNRMDSEVPKQFLKLRGKSLLAHSTEKFNGFPFFKSILIVSHPDFLEATEKEIGSFLREGDRIVEGGSSRHESTLCALNAISPDETDMIVIHDAARPFFSSLEIYNTCRSAAKAGASTLATNVSDTVVIAKQKLSDSILDRNSIYLIKTPQALQVGLYIEKLSGLKFDKADEPTDLCSWASLAKVKTALVDSNPFNIKITRREDLSLAEKIYDLFLDWENQNPFDPRNCGDCGCAAGN